MVQDDYNLEQLTKELPEKELSQEQLNEISELSKRGYQLLKESLTDRAAKIFLEIVSVDPKNNYALVGLGDAYRKDRRFRDAITYYKRCLEYHPGNNYALFGLADCYKALKQYNRAIDIWEDYIHHDDKNITVLTRIADAYRKVRDFKRSKELYLRVLEMEKTNSYALIGLGHLHYDFKEYEDALKYWSLMIENKKHVDIRVLTSVGNCHRKLKTFEDGVPLFKMALDKQPDNFYALFGLADCYRGMNQQSKSLIYWNKILDNDPRNKVILTRAGDAYRNMGDNETAEDYYRRALNIEFDSYAVLGLVAIHKENGRYEETISSLLELISHEPKNNRFYLEASDCYLHLNKKEEALKILSDYLRLGIRNNQVIDKVASIKAM